MNNTKYIEFNGVTKTLSQWAKLYDISKGTLSSRLYKYGWSIEQALTVKPSSQHIGSNDKARLGTGKKVTYCGKVYTLPELATELNISYNTVLRKYNECKSPEEIFAELQGKKDKTITYNGRTKTIGQWAVEKGLKPSVIQQRLKKKLPLDKVLQPGKLSRAVTLNFRGKDLTYKQWATLCDVSPDTIRDRHKKGLPINKVLKELSADKVDTCELFDTSAFVPVYSANKNTYSNKTKLSEQLLGAYLQELFPSYSFIHDKTIPETKTKYRPDYYCKELRLIVEFDGPLHFTQARTIHNDIIKDSIFKSFDITTIRIPYFIQLDSTTIDYFFDGFYIDKNKEFPLIYPHGFIDKGVILPADFCSLGLQRSDKLLRDIHEFTGIYDEIEKSYKYQREVLGKDKLTILPDLPGFIFSLDSWV